MPRKPRLFLSINLLYYIFSLGLYDRYPGTREYLAILYSITYQASERILLTYEEKEQLLKYLPYALFMSNTINSFLHGVCNNRFFGGGGGWGVF